MSVPVMPSWGPALGEAIGKIATGVRDIADPEAEMRTRIEQTLITNPEFAQSLADMEYQNPGAITQNMKKFFSRDASGLVSSLAPTMNARIARIIGDNKDLIAHDPTIAQDVVSRMITGRTPAQRTIERAQQRAVEDYTGSPQFEEDTPETGFSTAFPGAARARSQQLITSARIRDADLRAQMQDDRIRALTAGGWDNARALAEIYASRQLERDFARFSGSDRSTVNSLMAGINQYQNTFDTPKASEETRNGAITGINRNIAQINEILRQYEMPEISATVTSGRGTIAGMPIGRRKMIFTQGGEPIDINEFSSQLTRAVVPGGQTGSVGSTRGRRGAAATGGGAPQPAASGGRLGALRAQGEYLKLHPDIKDSALSASWSAEEIQQMRRWSKVPAPPEN